MAEYTKTHFERGSQMPVSKYEVLSALVSSQAKEMGDPTGLHFVLKNVVEVLRTEHGSEEELSDAIFDVIARAHVLNEEEPNEDQVDKT